MPTISGLEIRMHVLEQCYRSHLGHIGSCLSISDIVAVLYASILRIASPDDPDRDRFILSKGHAALAVYAALYEKGFISRRDLESYGGDNTVVAVHPDHRLSGIDFSTGSLGQGLSYGVGAALAAGMDGSDRRVYVLVSDAECNEGSLWESVMFASHEGLGSLTAIVDDNGQQAMGKTERVLNLQPLSEKWAAFGWDVLEVDGHNEEILATALNSTRRETTKPTVLIAHTISGRGVSFMEGKVDWHYLPMSKAQFDQAKKEIESQG